jgi:hypothetical protein
MSDIDSIISPEALKGVDQLTAALGKSVETLDTLVKKSAELDASFSKMTTSAKDNKTAHENINRAAKESIAINQQLRNAEDDVVKAKLRFARANKEQRDELKSLIVQEDKEAGTLEKLTARNAQLRKERNKLNLETAEGKKRLQEINAEINKNNAYLKQNSDALTKQKIGIGSYKESIIGAAKSLASFLGVAGGGVAILNKLKEAFQQTDTGVGVFKRITEASKTFFQNLVGGNVAGAGANSIVAAQIAKEMEAVRKGERQDMVIIAQLETDIAMLRYKAADATLSEKEQLDALTQAQAKEDELIKFKIADLKEEQAVVAKMLTVRQDDMELWDIYYNLQAQIIQVDGERNLRLERQTTALREKAQATKEATKAEADYLRVQGISITGGPAMGNVAPALSSELKFNDEIMASNEKMQEQMRRFMAEREAMEENLKQLKLEAIYSSFDIASALIDRQAAQLEASYKNEIKAAGDNEKLKEQIDAKYEKKRRDLAIKKAITDRAQALFSIFMDTRKGVMSYASNPLTAALVPWIIALGVIQAAAVVAAPIPQYAKGTRSSKGGPAIVGEMGHELMIDPGGRMALTGETAHLTMLRPGTKIIPSGETKEIMKAAALSRRSTLEDTLHRDNERTLEAIKKIRLEVQVQTGRSITVRDGNQWKEYFNRHLR